MDMPGRIFSSSNQYRYGFNGKEKETESPVQYDYGFRTYDPRLMRFKSVDPLQKKYSGENPYLYTGGNPIIYGDPDGRDRILMITIINEDGSMTRLQQTDYSKFNYTKENVYDGGMKYYRSSEIVDLIIDNRFGAQTTVDQAMNNPDAGNVRIQRTTIDEEQISGLTYYIYKIFGNPTNDRHLKSKVGIFTYGKGLNLGWQKMNETAAEGSESINLESLLDVVGAIGPNSSPSELYNEIVQKWMKHAGKDMKEVLTAINMIVKASDGATEAIDNV